LAKACYHQPNMWQSSVLIACCVAYVGAQSYYPEITLKGDNPNKFGPSEESWVDPGYTCYNPLEGPGNTVDVKTSGVVKLNTPGTYTVKYTCVNTNGLKATPATRTIIVDKGFKEDWWEGEAEIQIGGYDSKSFGTQQRLEFKKALATSLDIPEANIDLNSVSAGDAATNKMLHEDKSVNIHFTIKVVQEALIYELVARMKDPKFDSTLSTQMSKQGLDVNQNDLAVNSQTNVKKVIGNAVIAGLSAGAIICATFLSIGAYKLHQLANSGNVNMGSGSERSHLKGGVHDRL